MDWTSTERGHSNRGWARKQQTKLHLPPSLWMYPRTRRRSITGPAEPLLLRVETTACRASLISRLSLLVPASRPSRFVAARLYVAVGRGPLAPEVARLELPATEDRGFPHSLEA